MPKTKEGEQISWKEFGRRWKSGIESLSPLQKLENESRGTFITTLGYLVALIAVIININKIGLLAYGLILIFLGSLITSGLKWIALKQQLKFLKNLDFESIKTKEEIIEEIKKEVKHD
jgi:hypothetical protein